MSDARGRPLPRQLLRVKRSEPEEGVLRTELRFVVYEQRKEMEEEGSTEANAVSQALEALLKKFSEMSADPACNKSSFVKKKEKNTESTAQTDNRLKLLNEKLSGLERAASQIAPEVASFQVQLQALLEELDERKRGGQSPSSCISTQLRQRLIKLRDRAARAALVTAPFDQLDSAVLSSSESGRVQWNEVRHHHE